MGKSITVGIPGVTGTIPSIINVIGRVQTMREKRARPHQTKSTNVQYYTRIRRCLIPRLRQLRTDE